MQGLVTSAEEDIVRRLADYPDTVRHEWRLMAGLRARMPSVTLREIAQQLGRAVPTIYAWSRNPAYQRYEAYVINAVLGEMTTSRKDVDIREKLNEYAVEMADRLLDILDETTDLKLQKEIAEGWLDRVPGASTKSGGGRSINVVLPEGAVAALLIRAAEISDGHPSA